MKFRYIHIYPDPSALALDANTIKNDLLLLFPKCSIDVRKPFYEHFSESNKGAAEMLSLAMVSNVKQPFERQPKRSRELLAKDIISEKYFQANPFFQSFEILYDGFAVQNILRMSIPDNENNLNHVHLIFTNRLIVTFEEDDWKYHARPLVCGTPSVVSTSGIVEGPAKPREFYFAQMMSPADPEKISKIRETHSGRFIDYGDKRLTCVAFGYVLQALFFFITNGQPFCEDKNCRLFNSHWQEDLINSQVKVKRLCKKHSRLVKDFDSYT